MEAILELTKLITKNKVKRIDIIGGEMVAHKKSKEHLLFDRIQAGYIRNDEDAYKYLSEEWNVQDKAVYRKIKSKLKKKLINTCFFIDFSQRNFNDHQQAYYECYRYWAAQMILQGRGAAINCKEIANKLLKPIMKYEFTELGVNVSRKLIQEYAIEGKIKHYARYQKVYQQFVANWQQELKAEELYRDLSVLCASSSISLLQEVHQKACKATDELRPLVSEQSTYRFILMFGLIEVIQYLSINDYKQTVKVCKNIINRLMKKNFLAQSGIIIFSHKLVVCYTQLRKFTAGEKAIQLSLSYSIVGTANWFISMQLYFILAQRSLKYQTAYDIFNQVYGHSNLSKQRKGIIEVWKIYDAFLHFLIRIGKVFPEKKEQQKRKFSLAKFINEVPKYSKDKRGRNIPILVLQILFYLQQENRGKVIDRIEAIEKYCSRYLKKDQNTFRSNCFIKMLLLVPKVNFCGERVIQKTRDHLLRLQERPINLANQAFEIELIPYEDLWTLIVEGLSSRSSERC